MNLINIKEDLKNLIIVIQINHLRRQRDYKMMATMKEV